MRCLILIPTYNEAATLPGLLATLSALRPVVGHALPSTARSEALLGQRS